MSETPTVGQSVCRPDPKVVRGKKRSKLSDLDKPSHDWKPMGLDSWRCARCGATKTAIV